MVRFMLLHLLRHLVSDKGFYYSHPNVILLPELHFAIFLFPIGLGLGLRVC